MTFVISIQIGNKFDPKLAVKLGQSPGGGKVVAPSSETPIKKRRFGLVLPVSLSGTDAAGERFRQLAYTVDISNGGVRLAGVSANIKIGDPVEVQYKQQRARFRVVWAVKEQIGLEYLRDEKLIWVLPQDAPQEDVSSGLGAADVSSTQTVAVTKCSPEVGQQERSSGTVGLVAMPETQVGQPEPRRFAIVLPDDQNDQPQAAALTQDAITEATVATSTPEMSDKSPPLTSEPAIDPGPSRTSGQLKTPIERPSANQILEFFEQRIQQKLETISSSFEAGLQQQAFEILNRTQAELESKVSSSAERLRSQIEASNVSAAKLHQQFEARLQHSLAELQELETRWEEFRRFSSALESRTAELQRKIEEADRQITQRLQECSASCQEGVTKATEQVSSHFRAGVELAQKHIETSGRAVLTRIEETAKNSEEFLRRLDEAGVRIAKLAESAESKVEKSMLEITVEALKHLQKEVDDRIQQSASHLESTLAKAMESFCEALRDRD